MIYISLFPICFKLELKGVGCSMAFNQLPTSFMMFTDKDCGLGASPISSISIVFMEVSNQRRKSGSKEENILIALFEAI